MSVAAVWHFAYEKSLSVKEALPCASPSPMHMRGILFFSELHMLHVNIGTTNTVYSIQYTVIPIEELMMRMLGMQCLFPTVLPMMH